ncbi:MAG: hypothetical protein F6K04_10185 [Leptolyngbya sp. SIO4C5]|uniref:DUF6760 family protein n=1 Tax=Sphaerothrix gracilis TaxID=3151835 RepID=UPI0013C22321|nr:hypothetical protein [Leptolyngbya sp. SIO4C5]
MWECLRGGAGPVGGVVSYPSDQLHEEVAYIALHFHWSLEEILSLVNSDRRRWVSEIQAVRQQLAQQ